MKRRRRGMRGWRATAALVAAWLLGGAPRAIAQAPPKTFLLIVSGVSGEPRFAARFAADGAALRDAATTRFSIPDSQVVWLAENPAADSRRIAGRSTKGAVDSALARFAARARPNDRVVIVLMGHGSSDGGVSQFNLPGPDISDADFASLLERFHAQQVVFVNAASASGDFVKTLSARNRIILTATKSGVERNETLFGTFFVRAFSADGADVDKDGRVSMLEAFQFARREVQRDYELGGRLLTEHAMLDDDGDGVGHADASEKGPDGTRARNLYLAPPGGLSAVAAADPRAAALLTTRQSLEARIDSLRQAKATMTETDYQQALENLLVKLAETNRALKALGEPKP